MPMWTFELIVLNIGFINTVIQHLGTSACVCFATFPKNCFEKILKLNSSIISHDPHFLINWYFNNLFSYFSSTFYYLSGPMQNDLCINSWERMYFVIFHCPPSCWSRGEIHVKAHSTALVRWANKESFIVVRLSKGMNPTAGPEQRPPTCCAVYSLTAYWNFSL